MYTRNRKRRRKLEILEIKKLILIVTCILILNTVSLLNPVCAVNINSANIISGGKCEDLLKYEGEERTIYYAKYIQDGIEYPAYCLEKTKQDIDVTKPYSVLINNNISDVMLWKIIINGYPYKTIEELGCKNKEEAFSATKEAIYCYIHGNNRYGYTGIGEAGERTIKAFYKIYNGADACEEVPISNKVNIVKHNDLFEVDSIEQSYLSKTYSIQAETAISNYKIELQKREKELPNGIKITDINNVEKVEFSQNEKFKILIPIKNLTHEGDFDIVVSTKIKSKPVLFGQAKNSLEQDYALTTEIYEDATGKTSEEYKANETKIKIITQDRESKKRLENVEFNIYDSNKNSIYSNLKTNANGEIEIKNFLPGKYYIQEVSTNEGYILNNNLFEFEISFKQILTITVNNLFKAIPEKEIEDKKENLETIEGKKEDTKEEANPDKEETKEEQKTEKEETKDTKEELKAEEKQKIKKVQEINNKFTERKLPVTGM